MKAPMIYGIIKRLMEGIGPVKKTKDAGSAMNYAYWKIEQVIPKFRQLMIAEGCFLTSRMEPGATEFVRETSSGGKAMHRFMAVTFTLWAPDGSFMLIGPVPGEAMDSGDKAGNKAWTCALKNMFKHLLMIETEKSDPDHTQVELGSRRQPPPQARPAAKPAPVPDENAQIYAAVMTLLNARGKDKQPLLNPTDRAELKAKADAARAELPAIRAVYQAVKGRVDALAAAAGGVSTTPEQTGGEA
jgi:hypothetical protein